MSRRARPRVHRMKPAERLARARALRAALPQGKFTALDIDAAKRDGRP